MATHMGKSQETENNIWLTNWRRNAKRKTVKESMTDSCEIMNSVCEWLNIIEMMKFVDVGCSCRWRSHLSSVRRRILPLQEQMVAPSQWVGFWHPTIEKTFWFQVSVVHLRTFTPRRWRRTIRAHSLLEEQTKEVGIEFVLYIWWEWQTKSWERTVRPIVKKYFGEKLRKWLSRK